MAAVDSGGQVGCFCFPHMDELSHGRRNWCFVVNPLTCHNTTNKPLSSGEESFQVHRGAASKEVGEDGRAMPLGSLSFCAGCLCHPLPR